jgi:hypothetical protein
MYVGTAMILMKGFGRSQYEALDPPSKWLLRALAKRDYVRFR